MTQTIDEATTPSEESTTALPIVDTGAPKRSRFLTPALFVLAILAGLVATPFVARLFHPHAWAGTRLPNAEAAAPFDGLLLDNGEPARLDAHRGEVVLIYFGYTFCPDVCPLTLSVAATAIEELGDRGDDVQLFMVTLDPERDGLAELGTYVRHFDPDFRGVGGEIDDIADVAALYGVFHEQQAADDNGFYLVDHTATLLGVGPEGNLDVIWSPNVTSDDLRGDIEELLG